LILFGDELMPTVIDTEEPAMVVWSSIWAKWPNAHIRFDLPLDDSSYGTDLKWTLVMDEPLPDEAALVAMRKRVNLLINGNLRDTFDQ
jgi:hypothetical protein